MYLQISRESKLNPHIKSSCRFACLGKGIVDHVAIDVVYLGFRTFEHKAGALLKEVFNSSCDAPVDAVLNGLPGSFHTGVHLGWVCSDLPLLAAIRSVLVSVGLKCAAAILG